MKKYIFIALLVLSLGVAQPVKAQTREEVMIQLIATLTELVKQLQAQLVIALAQRETALVAGSVSVPVPPLTVSISGKASDNHYSFGGNCEMVVFLVNEPANVYNSETRTWSLVIDRFFFRPQSTSTRIDFVFTAGGDKRVDTWLDVGEAVDRSATTGQQFDYQLGKCK